MISTLLQKLLNHQDLTFHQTYDAIQWIMSEEATPVTASAFLVLLQAKGTTADEIAGAAHAMRKKSLKIKAPETVVDTCSTGGNGISTFNISTCAAIIAAAAGAKVAKHGNRSNTRKSGSAEALDALGVNINLDLPQVELCLAQTGICFCYAIKHHPAMRFAAPIRKELGIPTIFNILGPLTNPANSKNQVLGVPKVEWTAKLAHVLHQLGGQRAFVVTGADGLCELTTTDQTHVAELRDGQVHEYLLTPEELGLKRGHLKDIVIDSPAQSAAIIQAILKGEERGTARDIAALNAAAAITVAGLAEDLKEGLTKAQEAIESGLAFAKLQELVNFTQQIQ